MFPSARRTEHGQTSRVVWNMSLEWRSRSLDFVLESPDIVPLDSFIVLAGLTAPPVQTSTLFARPMVLGRPTLLARAIFESCVTVVTDALVLSEALGTGRQKQS